MNKNEFHNLTIPYSLHVNFVNCDIPVVDAFETSSLYIEINFRVKSSYSRNGINNFFVTFFIMLFITFFIHFFITFFITFSITFSITFFLSGFRPVLVYCYLFHVIIKVIIPEKRAIQTPSSSPLRMWFRFPFYGSISSIEEFRRR